MPTKPTFVKQFSAWSYSRLADWSKCPLMSKLKHLDRIKEPDSEPQLRGTAIHRIAEAWSTKKKEVTVEVLEKGRRVPKTIKLGAKVPDELKYFKEEFDVLRKHHRLLATEQQIGLDKEWGITEWFDSDADNKGLARPWVRIVMDCRYVVPPAPKKPLTMRIADYKTGKVREENKKQLDLYAAAAFAMDEQIEEVQAELWYLDQGELVVVTYTRSQMAAITTEWKKKSLPMLADQKFGAKPGNHCTWCHYRKANAGKGGGQCIY